MNIAADAYRRKNLWLVLISIWCVSVLSVMCWRGGSSRIILPETTVREVASPEQAYALWEVSGVRGRILLLFDDYPHMRGLAYYDGAPQLTAANFIEYSIFKNIVRKIYYVVDDRMWDAFRKRTEIGVFRFFEGGRDGLYLFTMSGVPMIAIPESFLPELHEKVLVHVNSDRFPYGQVQALLDRRRINSDMVTVHRGGRT